MPDPKLPSKLVSIVIPCFNQGHFLGEAIASVQQQSHQQIEIIVVDDGSTDNTAEVAAGFSNVKYHFQQNAGLPAARNNGFELSKGEFVVFLDADDWLYSLAIEKNMEELLSDAEAAFVSGAYEVVFHPSGKKISCVHTTENTGYLGFLFKNYVGVPAAVMYRRAVLEEYKFNPLLKSCEDYDLYLRISRKHRVLRHENIIAGYRRHSGSMSTNYVRMLQTVLAVLDSQKMFLKGSGEVSMYHAGRRFWKKYYARSVYESIQANEEPAGKKELGFLLNNDPRLFLKILIQSAFKKPNKQSMQ